jgi:hypothetical protein
MGGPYTRWGVGVLLEIVEKIVEKGGWVGRGEGEGGGWGAA